MEHNLFSKLLKFDLPTQYSAGSETWVCWGSKLADSEKKVGRAWLNESQGSKNLKSLISVHLMRCKLYSWFIGKNSNNDVQWSLTVLGFAIKISQSIENQPVCSLNQIRTFSLPADLNGAFLIGGPTNDDKRFQNMAFKTTHNKDESLPQFMKSPQLIFSHKNR